MFRTFIQAAIIVAAMLVSLHIAAAYADSRQPLPERVCFDASKWNANDRDRPCARIIRIWEDGSVRLKITDASGKRLAITSAGVPW